MVLLNEMKTVVYVYEEIQYLVHHCTRKYGQEL